MSDQDVDVLVRCALARESQAREELCRRIFRIAFGVAYRRFSFRFEDAEDVAQEVVVRSLQKLDEAPLNTSWIHNGATFLCIDIVRQRRTAATAERYLVQGRHDSRELTRIELRLLLERMPPRCARLLYRHFVEGVSFTELDAERGDGRRRCQFESKRCLDLLLARAGRLNSRTTSPTPSSAGSDKS